MKKKRLYSLLSVLLAFVTLLAGCFGGGDASSSSSSSSSSSNSSSSSAGDEYTLERGENEKQLTIYYQRGAGYDGCDVWMWYENVNGRGYELHECAYGAKVILNVPNTIDEVGFIIRTGCSDPGGETWGTATKDGTDADRSVALKGDETVIYTKAGDAKSYTSTDGGLTLKEIKYISLVDMQDSTHVKFVLSSAMKFDSLFDYQLKDGDGNAVGIQTVTTVGQQASYGVITTSQPLDLTKSYTLALPDLDPVPVVPNTYFSSTDFKQNYLYDGNDLGVTLETDKTTFKLWAPTASKVTLNLFNAGNGGEAYEKVEMTRETKGVWTHIAGENLSGKYYTYNVVTSLGDQEAVDPYAVSAGVNGNRGMILDMSTTNPTGWTNEVFDNPVVENYTDAVLWEVHVRDFSNKIQSSQYKGKFLAFTETGLTNEAGLPVGVDYLKELGITHVHLLPSYDYATVDEANREHLSDGVHFDPEGYNALAHELIRTVNAVCPRT